MEEEKERKDDISFVTYVPNIDLNKQIGVVVGELARMKALVDLKKEYQDIDINILITAFVQPIANESKLLYIEQIQDRYRELIDTHVLTIISKICHSIQKLILKEENE
jgi:hypothetical protein